jgi:hypothetical protein
MRRRRKSKIEPEHHYEIKHLIDGRAVGRAGMTLVAIPDHLEGRPARVHFNGLQMKIERVGADYVAYREFEDKFGRNKHYRLIYYEWKPMSQDEVDEMEAKKFLI